MSTFETCADCAVGYPCAVHRPASETERLPSVAGRFDRTLVDFERSCLVHLDEEQRRANPDNALIAVLCDSVRLGREAARPAVLPAHLSVVVNGQPVSVPGGPIRDVIAAAIQKAGQIGAPLDQWVLRTRDGDVIPHALPGGVEWALSGGQQLWLHLGLPLAEAARPAVLRHDELVQRLLAHADLVEGPPGAGFSAAEVAKALREAAAALAAPHDAAIP